MTQQPPLPPLPPVSPYQPQPAQAVAQPPPSSMGGWSLALGIIGIIPVCIPLGLVAIILGIIALCKPAASKGKAIGGIVTGALALLLMPMLFAIFLSARNGGLTRTTICASNLQAVGIGVRFHMSEDDAPPPDLDVLIQWGVISQERLECPSAKRRKPMPHYFYLAPPADAPATTIIMCDLRGNHPRDGRNALTLNGSVKKFKTEADFQAVLNQSQNAAFAAALREAEGP